MAKLIELLGMLPSSVQIVIASLFVGGGAVAGLEARYMTVSDFTKSYVLDLKAEIRAIKNELKAEDLTDRERESLEEELEELIDELCYENPEDRYCAAET